MRQQLLQFTAANQKRKSASKTKSETVSKGSSGNKTPTLHSKNNSLNITKAQDNVGRHQSGSLLTNHISGQKNTSFEDRLSIKPRLSVYAKGTHNLANFASPPNRSPVNIFNFNTFNIIKPEKVQIDADPQDVIASAAQSPRNQVNTSNYFIFMKKKKTTPSHTRMQSETSKPKSQNKSAFAGLSETSRSKPLGLVKKRQEGDHTGSLTSATQLSVENRFHNNTRNESLRLNFQSLENIEILHYISDQKHLLSYLDSVCKGRQQSSHTTASSRSVVQSSNRPSVLHRYDYSELKETKTQIDAVLAAIEDFSSVLPKKAMPTVHKSTQSNLRTPKEIQYTNLNFVNLMKEIAKGIISKSKLIKEGPDDQVFFPTTACPNPQMSDEQKTLIFLKSLILFQEQIIFEEALKILQEKGGVDIEYLFGLAYQKLDIRAKDGHPGEPQTEDQIDPSLRLSGVSLDSESSAREANRSVWKKPLNCFTLDFSNLKESSLSELSEQN